MDGMNVDANRLIEVQGNMIANAAMQAAKYEAAILSLADELDFTKNQLAVVEGKLLSLMSDEPVNEEDADADAR